MKFQCNRVTSQSKFQITRTAFLPLAVLFLIQLLAVSASAEAGKIAYTNGNAIYKMNQDGTGVVQLTFPASGQEDYSPVWSRDGLKIAFVRRTFETTYTGPNGNDTPPTTVNNFRIYVADYNGGNMMLIKNSDTLLNDITWSPDGGRIAYVQGGDTTYEGVSYQCAGNSYIYISYVSGLGYSSYISEAINGLDPSWSPDGSKIYYASNVNEAYGIYSVNLQTKVVNRLTYNSKAVADPEVSPDGTKIVYGIGYPQTTGCFFGNMSTINPVQYQQYEPSGVSVYNILTNTSSSLVEGGNSPSWNPGGNIILYIGGNSFGEPMELFTINANGTGATQVPNIHSSETSASWSN